MLLLAAKVETDWAAWLTGIGTVGLGLIALVTVIFAWRQLNDAQITRHGELMLTMCQRWDVVYYESAKVFGLHTDAQITTLLDNMFGKGTPGQQDVEEWLTLVRLPNLIEEIADFRRYGAISLPAIDVIWGDRIISAWRQWRPMVHELRRVIAATGGVAFQPEAFRDFQRLAVELELKRSRTKPAYHGLPAAVALAAEHYGYGGNSSFAAPLGCDFKSHI